MASNKNRCVINCGNEDHAFLAYLSMFRYAFGRMTYMPSVIQGLIKLNSEALTERTLRQLDKELNDEEEYYQRLYGDMKPTKPTNYGSMYDRDEWIKFHEWVKEELKKKNEKTQKKEKRKCGSRRKNRVSS